MKNQSLFKRRFMRMIAEDVSTASAGMGSTSGGVYSGDFYAAGDARIPTSIFGGTVIRRNKSTPKKKKPRSRTRRKKK
tara:strand:- start:638 stop:871 length:234 start_codon:yes stop_codon:yes gene_type:complete